MNKPAKPKRPARSREDAEMVDRLEGQLDLLDDHAKQAFANGNSNYCSEVATKLRVLVIRAGMNTPLLFEVAKRFGVDLTVVVPPDAIPRDNNPTGSMHFERFFDRISYMFKGERGPEYIKHSELIRVWAEQNGGAHVDWQEEIWLGPMLQFHNLLFDGLPPAEHTLRALAEQTLQIGRRVVSQCRGYEPGPSLSENG